eukprot:m.1287960 g.1287960  ORF g.1287960 m.1287960 type:complete len:53 (+) comp24781_c0_seq39:6651-6809(+)
MQRFVVLCVSKALLLSKVERGPTIVERSTIHERVNCAAGANRVHLLWRTMLW